MNNFDFSIGNRNLPKINITSNVFTFNRAAIDALGLPEFIMFGYDKEKKLLAIKPVSNKDTTANLYPFAANLKNNERVTIVAKTVLQEIIKHSDFKPARSGTKFFARHDKNNNMLIIDFA